LLHIPEHKGRTQDANAQVEVDNDSEYEVEEVLEVIQGKDELLRYKVNWLDCNPDPEFYLAEDFKYCPQKLRDYHLQQPRKPGPPRQLKEWLNAWEGG